jgi:serine/threonine-protein kinase HipA
VSEGLAIWLYGRNVATVEQERASRLRLSYTEEALAAYPRGTPLLSLSLPLIGTRYPNGVTRSFLDGLLPEGTPRNAIAADLNLRSSDVFGLLAALGKDCAGALVVQPQRDPPPAPPSTRDAEPLSEDDLAQLVAHLRSAPLGVDRDVRLSLAGVQEKLLLTRMPDGRWGRPVHGTPSTHILKPEIENFGNTVENEAFSMRLARHLGLSTASVETVLVDGHRVLVVERYDRMVTANGSVTRIHQEDFCQALGLPPAKKYEQDGGPTLARIAGVLRDIAGAESIDTFLRSLTINVALGNCDAHGKNFSLLHTESGQIKLAPLYDLLSTRLYPIDEKLAMYVDTVRPADRVTAERIVNEAASWGLSRAVAEAAVGETLSTMPAAVEAAAEETDGLPAELPALVLARVEHMTAS